jgi:hypothetical protein
MPPRAALEVLTLDAHFRGVSDLRPAGLKKRPSKRRFQAGVVQKSASVHACSDVLQTYENLVCLRVAKLRNFGKKSRGWASAVHRSSEKHTLRRSLPRRWPTTAVQLLPASAETRRASLGTNST